MTKLYIFIQKILALKRKLSAQFGYNRGKYAYSKIEASQKRKMVQFRSKKRLMDQLMKKYRTRPLASQSYEKWI